MTASDQSTPGWHFFVDRGGTFTDLVAISPDGRLITHKLLSEDPSHYDDAALAGIDRILAEHAGEAPRLSSVRIGTTIGTNALLERRGARTVLVITRGFADLLKIGTQQRPDIFALEIRLPEMLYSEVIEADERIDAAGHVIADLDAEALEQALARARASGIASVAIAFANAYMNPAHELEAQAIANRAGFAHVSTSCAVNPEIRLVERGETAVVDAYLTPVLDAYKASLTRGLADRVDGEALWFMQSHGGLVAAEGFRGADSILSGPAGGVVGMVSTARESGFDAVIGFDMGGTSTDVSVFAGNYERTSVATIAGLRIARPMLRINTVAAGGGSLLTYRNGRLQVGPDSAGAHPGPVCYRNGGPLTLTDANVQLGRIQADCFPHVFGPAADEPIDAAAVARAFDDLAARIVSLGGPGMSAVELADGFQRIAIANMAAAIEQISIQRGHDVTRFALACFGGAGGQHACGVADALGIETILVHPLSGVLSAYGIGVAERRSILSAALHETLDAACVGRAREKFDELRARLETDFSAGAEFECRMRIRAAGSDTLLEVPLMPQSTHETLAAGFAGLHRQRFGFDTGDVELIVQSVDVEAIASIPLPAAAQPARDTTAEPVATRPIWFGSGWLETPIYRRAALGSDCRIAGPALIAEDNATIVVEPDWTLTVDRQDCLIVTRTQPRQSHEDIDTRPDPIMLEIFNNQFMHIAEQMGAVLEQTAHSVNIKERLDYSCALFDQGGELIANAPHVPVHLGSMGDSVREVIRCAGDFRPGEAWMLNAPYAGGTHLPDITVVTPVFDDPSKVPEFYVASRAHHADIGGSTPGSMPALSRSIDEEGIVIEPVRIVADNTLLEARVLSLLSAGPYPARNPRQNLADLKAQLAANVRGRDEIERLLTRYGNRVVHAYMRHVRNNAEACTRQALRKLEGGSYLARLDSGEQIAVDIAIDASRGKARIDFSGTGGISNNNLNAPLSVVRAVVLYVLRTLIRDNIPLNAGCLVPVEIVVPPNSLLDPVPPAAVAGGNVETSQCIADVLLAAFGAAAASQGTMNNLTFGNERHQYYETICGGAGAGPGFNGASAVHTHMTNSRLTDVEVLEQRYPVRVTRFAIRGGSGGTGQWRGGDGVIREFEFLEPMHASLLANRRSQPPFGLAGGEDAKAGCDTIIRRGGTRERLSGSAEFELEAGDRLRIETPGGGGYGAG